ncbi:uncharacterized protein LOC130973287 [Arachis stenosperma]|uniref:uncharacterized protein LOC130973287 n=1 Tax=Arachis stenosperma TaxID=217475 RepID=UPI0025AC7506|nr:uncharacterized protein LOC130973287 [Arachis stenosperma]
MAETASNAAEAPTPPVRLWRTAFLTLRDETLTAPPSSSSTPDLLRNLIFSQSYTLLSALPELPSHEVLSDILFLMELVLVSASCLNQEECTHIYTQTSRLIHDICRGVSFDVNPSSFTGVVNAFSKMLDLFPGKVAIDDESNRIRSSAGIISAIECLQAFRCIITSSQRRWLQSEDTLLVKFLLNIIASYQAAFWLMPHSMSKDKIDMRLSIESSSCELQTVAFGMLSKAISRAGSSFSVDMWRSMIKVVRKTMDFLAQKSSFVEDNVMSRFYESFLSCLHLILTDSKCSVSDHVSVFVAVLQMFLTYGLCGLTPSTPVLIGRGEKECNAESPRASWEQVNRSNRTAYRPPHLRKRECSKMKLSRAWDSQNMSDSESFAVNFTSSDSDFSDGDGSAKESGGTLNSRVRVAALICIQDLCQADSKSFSMQWSLLLPTSDVLQPRKRDATLMTCLLFDPCLKVRMASASTLVAMLDGLSSIFLQVAEYKDSSKFGSFTALSSSLGQILLELHRGILFSIQQEAHGKLLALLFKILRLVILSTPYSRMPPNLLATVVTSVRTRIREGFQFKSDQSSLLAAAVGCLTLALCSSSSTEVRKMLYEEVSSGYIKNEKKSGVLFMLFEYSLQWSCPTICLEALQALKAVCHNYPSIVTACWERVSAIVSGFLSFGYPEISSRKSSEHGGSPTAFVSEKVLAAAIKVLDECLRALSGFQGTEDLSDDKLADIPFASDFIRGKKVSSAPLYESEGKDDDVVNSEASECGIHEWCEAIEKHMPCILCHSSSLVRAASITCFAGMTSSVFISFTMEKQGFILSSLINAAINDDVPSVRSSACRAIGVVSCFPQVCQSAEVLDRFIHAVEINTCHTLISVRITASWALANICDAIRHTVSLEHMGSNSNLKLIVSLSECALHLTEDGDKVKSNAVRALGYISRIFKCSTSRFQDMSMDHLGPRTEGYSCSQNLIKCQRSNSNHYQLDYHENYCRLERIVKALISCVITGNVKVQWNVCHALGNLFLNETLSLQDMDWASDVYGVLLQLLRESSNYKIRIQAAAALAVPASVHDYGPSFSDIVQCVEDVMENIGQDQISGPSNFKYRVSLQKQLTLTMLHVLSFTSSTDDDQLKDFLVQKALILEDWFKGLCSSVEGELDVQDKIITDRKKVMICNAIQSLTQVYKGKQQDAIAQRFEELEGSL